MVALLGMIVACSVMKAVNLPIAQGIARDLAIYHIKANQLENWSCGYNVLFNACNLENHLGFHNAYSFYSNFKRACTEFINAHKKKPEEGITNKDMATLAQRVMLKRNHYLYIDEQGKVVPFIEGKVSIMVPPNTSEDERQQLLKQEVAKKQRQVVQEIQNSIGSVGTGCVHFFCHVLSEQEGHCILITLHKNNYGLRSLYIFDNLNAAIQESPSAKYYIDYISTEFKVSQSKLCPSLTLPDVWPTAPAPIRVQKVINSSKVTTIYEKDFDNIFLVN